MSDGKDGSPETKKPPDIAIGGLYFEVGSATESSSIWANRCKHLADQRRDNLSRLCGSQRDYACLSKICKR